MKNLHLIYPLLACLLFASCIDDIKLDIDNDQQKVTVDGLITDSLQEHTIKLTLSTIIGVSQDDVKTPITGATVRVLDDAGGSYEFSETKAGTYTSWMQGTVGRAYHIEVKTKAGKTILSKPTVLKKSPPILEPSVRVFDEASVSQTGQNIYQSKLELLMNADVSNLAERPYLRWRTTGEYEIGEDYPNILDRKICYVKNNLDFNNVKVFNTSELEGGRLTKEPFLITKYDFRFGIMYCFHLLQYAMSEEEYHYWENVRSIVNIDGSLFDPPPGTVKGNLYNPNDPDDEIIGFFSVSGVSYRRFFTNAVDLNIAVLPHCGIRWPPDYPAECYNCLTLPNSVTQRPSYWKP